LSVAADRPHAYEPCPAPGSAADLARRIAAAELAEGLAHDLRNQLTVVATAVQIAREALTGGLEAELLDRAWHSAMRAARLLDELLRYCDGDDGDGGASDPAEALESAVAGAWRYCAARRVRLEMRAAAGLPSVRGPAPAVRVLFLYLLREAAGRCSPGAVLVAEAVPDGGDVLLRVRAEPGAATPTPLPESGPEAEMLEALAREVGASLDLGVPTPQVRLAGRPGLL
jgi:signal transduction histidine kinase